MIIITRKLSMAIMKSYNYSRLLLQSHGQDYFFQEHMYTCVRRSVPGKIVTFIIAK